MDDDLALSLEELSGWLTGDHSLERTLEHVAELAVRAVPGADGAGLTLLEVDRPHSRVATEAFVLQVDDVQYGLAEGPCISAVEQRRAFVSGNLGGDLRWPRFGPRAGRLGVHSALSLPLRASDENVGALNLYARPRDGFDAEAVRLGEAFAGPAAVSVANALVLARAERLVGQLSAALRSRAEIDHALGIVMSRTGGSAEDAFRRLREQSQARQVKLVVVARELVADARARATARHTAGPAPAADVDPLRRKDFA